MDINELTLGQLKEIAAMVSCDKSGESYPIAVGKNIFCRTVTHYFTGRLVQVTRQELVITDAAWIANTGRYMQALVKGVFEEVEPYPDGVCVVIPRGTVVDVSEWGHGLPRDQK